MFLVIDWLEKIRRDSKESPGESGDGTIALRRLCGYLYKYHGEKVILLLDEYDTPMLEACAAGYWEELVLFNAFFE